MFSGDNNDNNSSSKRYSASTTPWERVLSIALFLAAVVAIVWMFTK